VTNISFNERIQKLKGIIMFIEFINNVTQSHPIISMSVYAGVLIIGGVICCLATRKSDKEYFDKLFAEMESKET